MRGQTILLEPHHRTQTLFEEGFRKNGSTGKPFTYSARSPFLNSSDLAEKCSASAKYGLLRPKGTVMSKTSKYSTKKKRQHSIIMVMVPSVLEKQWEQSDSLYFLLHQAPISCPHFSLPLGFHPYDPNLAKKSSWCCIYT